MRTESAIVLNGSYHNSLTIVRSLGRRGIRVIVGDKARGVKSYFGEAMLSRYAAQRFLYPSPSVSPDGFINEINHISTKYDAKVLLPVGSDTCVTTSAFRDRLSPDIKTALADDALIQKAHDKYICLKYAGSIGIHIPETVLLKEVSNADNLKDFGLPLVVKPRKGAGNFGVRIVDDLDEVMRLRNDLGEKSRKMVHQKAQPFSVYDDSDPMVQEFLAGPIVDACVLAEHGKIKAVLTQQRVKTLPPRGGYGVMNRTVSIPEVREMAAHLLESMGWHGLAQVEFKLDTRKKQYKLMEVNPKFWGTLALSVAAGIDFPYMAYRIAQGEYVQPITSFKENCVFRWVLPNELLHVVQSDDRVEALRRYIRDFFRPAHYNIEIRDPLPALSLMLKFFNKGLL